jgi:predicted XRE-type DNA-binding protein
MSLLGAASRIGVTTTALQGLLQGRANVAVASKLGVTTTNVQEFINGRCGPGMAQALGVGLASTGTELALSNGKAGAIGIIVGALLGKVED